MAVTMGHGALATINLMLGQGQHNVFQMVWKPEGGVGKDLTGWTARAQARKRVGVAQEWFTVTTEGTEDGVIVLGADGSIAVEILPETSTRWGTSNRAGVWDLELIDPEGVVTTFARGEVAVELEVTTVGDL